MAPLASNSRHGHGREVDRIEAARTSALATVRDEDEVDRALARQQEQHKLLSVELHASSSSLEVLLAESRQALQQLQERAKAARSEFAQLEDDVIDYRDAVISPLSSRNRVGSGQEGAYESGTLVERLQGMHARIRALEDAHRLFGYLAKAEETALIAKEQVKLPSPQSAIDTYLELVAFCHEVHALASDTSGLRIAPFVREIAENTLKHLAKSLEGRLVAALEALAWPAKKLDQHDLDYQSNIKARAFRVAFVDLLKLEQTVTKNPLPNTSSHTTESTPACSLPITALAQPLILRFRYHFDGKRQTNRLDKPEWYFAHILNALGDHAAFIQNDVQELLRKGGSPEVDAMDEFITALLRPLTRKIRASIPQLLELPSILAHTLYQALQFDTTLKESFGYPAARHSAKGKGKEWKGTADIVLGNQSWFEGWQKAEKKVVDDKYFSIISSPDAWHINEDYAAASSGILRPTNSALRIRDLFDQVTDLYRPLPAFRHRLPFFLDIQQPLIDGYYQRISSATDAFETLSFGLMRAVPGSIGGGDAGPGGTKLTNGINGLQRLVRAGVSATWMETQCKEWCEDIFFLDLWQDMRETAIVDASIRAKGKQLLDPVVAKGSSGGGSGLFDTFISGFHQLADRIESLIIKHVVREITGELKSYLARRWDASFDGPLVPEEVSPDLVSALTVFSALLGVLATNLPAITLTRIYRAVSSQIQELLITRSVLPKIWSEGGGRQFAFDAESGWLRAAREAAGARLRRPENGLRRLLDAAKLVSLPASTSEGNASATSAAASTTIAKVVQVTWDDTNDAAFNEMLMRLGIKELISRKDVKAILRKRPECWR